MPETHRSSQGADSSRATHHLLQGR